MDLTQCFNGFGFLILVIVGVFLLLKLVTYLTHPAARKMWHAIYSLWMYKQIAKRMPEGMLLDVYDSKIRDLAHAMLLDGMTTKEVNQAVVNLTEDSLVDSVHPERFFGTTYTDNRNLKPTDQK